MAERPSFTLRTIQAGADGFGFMGVRGFGLEIVDGGAYGPENTLILVREDGYDSGSLNDDVIPCATGARAAGRFSGLQLVTARTSPALDKVQVKVWTSDLVQSVDGLPTGKPRVLSLARGSVTINADTYQLIYASATGGEFDRFRQAENYDVRRFFSGWAIQTLGSPSIHEVVIYVRQNPFTPSTWMLYTVLKSQNLAITGGFVPHAPNSTVVLFEGSSSSGVNPPVPIPPGGYEVYIHNRNAAAAVFEYSLAAVGA